MEIDPIQLAILVALIAGGASFAGAWVGSWLQSRALDRDQESREQTLLHEARLRHYADYMNYEHEILVEFLPGEEWTDLSSCR